jgi:anoctamin-10
VEALATVGLATEVRVGDKHSLLVFVKVGSKEHLYGEVYRSRYDKPTITIDDANLQRCRVRDWIHGVRAAEPKKETQESLEAEPLYTAERLRIIYQLITHAPEEGGAGITPKHGEWKNVESIFALHDHDFNKQWIKKWSTSYLLKPEDLDAIRDQLGEKVRFLGNTLT